MSNLINDDQIECLHIQINSITRYLYANRLEEEVSAKLYKLIRKITRVRQLNQLTVSQYNVIMHHLRRLEYAAHTYYWSISFLERELFKQILKCNVIANTNEYTREEFSAERLAKTQKKAKSIINFERLFEI
jgi:predicted alpha/beta-fold hydrolase